MKQLKRLAIGICTFQRPKMLRDCILAISRMEIPGHMELIILIVDNDTSTKNNLEDIRCLFPIHYCIEEKRGIPFARNRAIEEAIKLNCSEFAFIDDDEIPSETWIKHLWNYYITHDVAIVTGPVIPIFSSPSSFAKESLYSGKRFETGTDRPYAATGNVLFDLGKIKELGLRFDTQFSSGGEDEDFFRDAVKKGLEIVWVDEAKVYEIVPESRLNLTYLLRRNFKFSFAGNKFHRKHYGLKGTLSSIAKGFIYMGYAYLLWPLGLVLGKEHFIKCLTYMARGAGWFAGFRDVELNEYAKIHGQ